ncbi:hypothetical protein N656DRAFT_383648 [Canariomyces notabilis]|uniref:Uncharacterized protein n=1 Tax=Canariomyces notabilis TaxID=2074819 RepID=A0AAN6TK28_9PEZI|nr:hypothetical protein N656DRAFT_383648 [Canariomyces arenarius]
MTKKKAIAVCLTSIRVQLARLEVQMANKCKRWAAPLTSPSQTVKHLAPMIYGLKVLLTMSALLNDSRRLQIAFRTRYDQP